MSDPQHREKDALNKAIRGGLLDTINAHGPIDRQEVASAAKRIAGQIVCRIESLEAENRQLRDRQAAIRAGIEGLRIDSPPWPEDDSYEAGLAAALAVVDGEDRAASSIEGEQE